MEQTLDLLQLCYEFKVDKLKKTCEDNLKSALCTDNVTVILRRVYELQDGCEELKKGCIEFIM